MPDKGKPAKRTIEICLGSSCFSRGNKANVEAVRQFLADNRLDAEISFSGRLCEDMCGRGPVISVDGRVYEEVKLSRLIKILQEEFAC